MKHINLFPTVISSTILKDISNNEIQNYIKKLYEEGWVQDTMGNGCTTDNQDVLDLPIFLKLKNNILNLSKEYFKNLGFKNYNFRICSSWGNLVNSNEQIRLHNHQNSFLSGCFYLSPFNSSIFFKNPLISNWLFFLGNKPLENQEPQTLEVYNITPKQNELLLFPSWLDHGVTKSQQDKRISIAFNILPTGLIGSSSSFAKL